jgi:hypothetical protein
MLRANALGSGSPAAEFTLFLRKGMSGWFRSIQHRGLLQKKIQPETASVFTELDVDMPEAGFCSILADALLNAHDDNRQVHGDST